MEVLESHIFSLIPIGQLNECRMVCKKWLLIIDSMFLDTLVITSGNYLPVAERWFHTGRPVNCQNAIIGFKNFELESRKKLFQKFRKVFIYDSHPFYHWVFVKYRAFGRNSLLDIFLLNYFQELRELHFGEMPLVGKCELVLPNLRFFKYFYITGRLTLKAARLERISTYCMRSRDAPKFTYPGSILHLEATHYDLEGGKNLYNLEILSLKFKHISLEGFLNLKKKFKKLKEVHVYHVYHLEAFKRYSCSNLFQKLKELGLRVYLSGLELGSLIDLDYSGEGVYNNLFQPAQVQAYLERYESVSEQLPTVFEICYSALENSLSELPKNFFEKLVALREVVVTERVENEANLEWFLIRLPRLATIKFECSVSQHFYFNVLPRCSPQVEWLYFKFNGDEISFDFLTKLHYLRIIHLPRVDLDILKVLFQNLNYLNVVYISTSYLSIKNWPVYFYPRKFDKETVHFYLLTTEYLSKRSHEVNELVEFAKKQEQWL